MTDQQGKPAVIFDMDGTLVDNMAYHLESWLVFFRRHGIHMTDDEFRSINHGTIQEIIANIFGKHLSKAAIQELGHEKEKLYRDLYRQHLKPIEGLNEFLDDLKAGGIPLAMATMGNQDNIDFTIDGLQIRDYFDAIVGGDDVTHGKPNPEVFLKSASRLNVPSQSCIVFEDSFSGIQSAQNAKMKVVALTTSHSKQELEPLAIAGIINNYREVDRNKILRFQDREVKEHD